MNPILVVLVAWLALVSPSAHSTELCALGEDGKLDGFFAELELHASILSDATDWSALASTFGYALKGGHRWSSWGVFVQFEQNFWLATEQKTEVVQGAYNIGVGGELTYADGFVHTSLALGPSILAFDTTLDRAGSVGFFLDVRPVGLRWTVHDHIVLGLDPLGFTLVMPVLSGIPLINLQYRTTFYVEGLF